MEAGPAIHVLLVDDEPNLLRVLQRGLDRNGFQVTACLDSQSAIDALREDPDQHDIIVTDLGLPRINGIELARQALDLRADLPILLTSGYMDDANTARATAAGISRIMQKPIKAQDLSDTIRELCAA